MKKLVSAVSLMLLLSAGCLGGGGSATDSVCPTTPVTYASFGQTFFSTYCVRCHGEYSSEAGVKRDLSGIDQQAAKGPSATNTSMPNGSKIPTEAEREMLGQYLACSK
jgi:mono/diheme cytochrome c family protein